VIGASTGILPAPGWFRQGSPRKRHWVRQVRPEVCFR